MKSDDIVAYVKAFYEGRRERGEIVEKANSVFAKGGYTEKEAERNILSNPFKRFEDMNMMRHTKTIGIIEVNHVVWKRLTDADKRHILKVCDEKIEGYYKRLGDNG